MRIFACFVNYGGHNGKFSSAEMIIK